MYYKRDLTINDLTKDKVEINYIAVVVDEVGFSGRSRYGRREKGRGVDLVGGK